MSLIFAIQFVKPSRAIFTINFKSDSGAFKWNTKLQSRNTFEVDRWEDNFSSRVMRFYDEFHNEARNIHLSTLFNPVACCLFLFDYDAVQSTHVW